jgi:hypothetical protein
VQVTLNFPSGLNSVVWLVPYLFWQTRADNLDLSGVAVRNLQCFAGGTVQAVQQEVMGVSLDQDMQLLAA